jgi:hypothetical protein
MASLNNDKKVQLIHIERDNTITHYTFYSHEGKCVTEEVKLTDSWDKVRKEKEAFGFVHLDAKDYDTGASFKALILPEDIDRIDVYKSGRCEIEPHGGFFELHVDLVDLPDNLKELIVRN